MYIKVSDENLKSTHQTLNYIIDYVTRVHFETLEAIYFSNKRTSKLTL